jgi:hypothetical protein
MCVAFSDLYIEKFAWDYSITLEQLFPMVDKILKPHCENPVMKISWLAVVLVEYS